MSEKANGEVLKCDYCMHTNVDKTAFPCRECCHNHFFKNHFKPHPVFVKVIENGITKENVDLESYLAERKETK